MKIITDPSFEKDIKKLFKKHYKFNKLDEILNLLQEGKSLPSKYKDHALKGNLQGLKDCHIEKDLVLIYRIEEDTIILIRIGKHDEVF
jgi:mRNA interferase YafQ